MTYPLLVHKVASTLKHICFATIVVLVCMYLRMYQVYVQSWLLVKFLACCLYKNPSHSYLSGLRSNFVCHICMVDMKVLAKSCVFVWIWQSIVMALIVPSGTWGKGKFQLKNHIRKEFPTLINDESTSSSQGIIDGYMYLQKKQHLHEGWLKQTNELRNPTIDDTKKEKCILVAVDKSSHLSYNEGLNFSTRESLDELCELVSTANMMVTGLVVQRMSKPHARTYLGTGKIHNLIDEIRRTQTMTIVVDDDLTPQQQRSLEDIISEKGIANAKILDRTAVILEIFAQHAKSREGQLQVELAMLEYRMTRGPRARGGDYDSGCGFRGPGETKVETDKRIIKEKILSVKKELQTVQAQRELQRKGRNKLNLPIVTLVGYTNAGKSTLMNRLSNAGVLAENMLFATLDPTTRKVRLPKESNTNENSSNNHSKGQEVFLSDTVGFISKLPTNLIAAFRATLEEVVNADVLVLVCDRSSPVWEKQRNTVLQELIALNCSHIPIVEFWNKIDLLPNPELIRREALSTPIDVDAVEIISPSKLLVSNGSETMVNFHTNNSLSKFPEDDSDDENLYLTQSFDDYVKEKENVLSSQNERGLSYKNKDGPKRRYFTVAASARTGMGLEDFIDTLSDVLSQFLVSVTIIVPYKEASSIVDMVFQQGVVESLEHLEQGTKIVARVPESLIMSKLLPFMGKG